ncbi:MAG: hypothetical protein ACOX8N_01085 [Christensenellales bacterium]|jgi:flagellar motility protein MotE (MotC chaperone)
MQAEKQRTQQNTNTAAAKPGAAIKLTQAGKAASPQPQKSKKKISAGAVLAIFLLVVIIAAGVLVYLNVGGLRQKLVTFLQAGLAVEGETEAITAAELEQKQKELDDRAAELDAQADRLRKKSKELSDKEKELKDWDAELKDREEALASAETSVQQAQVAQNDLEATAKIFAAMDSKVAATAISGLDSVDDMVALLLKIPSNKAADIVSNMEAKLATKVLSEMMK